MADVDMTNSTFIISGDMVGEWEGGIPPEATGPDEDGNYVIQSWPIAEVIDNGDGTVTLVLDLDEMDEPFDGGSGEPDDVEEDDAP